MVGLCWVLIGASLLAEEPPKMTDAEALELRGKVWAALADGGGKALASIRTALERRKLTVPQVEEMVRAGIPYGEQPKGEATCDLTVRADGTKTEYGLYVPQSYDPAKRMPLVVELHGSGDAGPHYLRASGWKEVADAEGIVVAAPTSPREKGQLGTRFGAELVFETIRDVRKRYDIDPDRVYLSGFSRGGHATWWLGLFAADRFAGIAPRAGSPRELLTIEGGKERIWEFFPNLRPVPVCILHGAEDPLVKADSARLAADRLKELEVPYELHVFEGRGHECFADQDRPLWEFWKRHPRDPVPRKLSWVSNDRLFMRAWWTRIDELRSSGGPLDMIIQDPSGKTIEKRTLSINTARLTVEVKDRQTISVTGRNCAAATLWLDDRIVDLDKEVTVSVEGRSEAHRFTRSLKTLLETAAERLDPQMAFTVKESVRFP